MQTYVCGNFPVFEEFNHMQYQIRDPEGFARMLETIMETDRLPKLTFAIWYISLQKSRIKSRKI